MSYVLRDFRTFLRRRERRKGDKRRESLRATFVFFILCVKKMNDFPPFFGAEKGEKEIKRRESLRATFVFFILCVKNNKLYVSGNRNKKV